MKAQEYSRNGEAAGAAERIYRHRFEVRAPVEGVAEFHRRAASMAAITPPPVVVQMQRTPAILAEGDEMEFTLWLGPVPIHWLARIEGVSSSGFSDRQLRGPFALWVHRHQFRRVGEDTTEVSDEISLSLRPEPLWRLLGLGFRLGLPLLFAYRAWKTRRLLQ